MFCQRDVMDLHIKASYSSVHQHMPWPHCISSRPLLHASWTRQVLSQWNESLSSWGPLHFDSLSSAAVAAVSLPSQDHACAREWRCMLKSHLSGMCLQSSHETSQPHFLVASSCKLTGCLLYIDSSHITSHWSLVTSHISQHCNVELIIWTHPCRTARVSIDRTHDCVMTACRRSMWYLNRMLLHLRSRTLALTTRGPTVPS